MRKYFTATSVTVLLLVALFAAVFGDPAVYLNGKKLQSAVLDEQDDTVVLHELTDFDWDAVYTFEPYTSRSSIEQVLGFASSAVQETVSEGMTQLLFVQGQRVVCSVCAYPENLGYGVSGLPAGRAVENQIDGPRFRVERRGEVVWLTYLG